MSRLADINVEQHDNEAEKEPYRNIIKDIVIEFKWPIIIAGILIGILVSLRLSDANTGVTVPPTVYTALHWGILGVVVSAYPMKTLIESFLDPDVNPILVINYEEMDVRPRLYNLGDKAFADLTVVGGKLVGDGMLKVAVDYQPEDNVAEGVPIEDLSEMQILRFKTKLREARSTLFDEASKGMAARESVRMGMFVASERHLRKALQKLAGEGIFNGDDINNAIDEVIEEAQVDTLFDEIDDMDTEEKPESLKSAEGEQPDSVLRDAREIEAQADTGGDDNEVKDQ